MKGIRKERKKQAFLAGIITGIFLVGGSAIALATAGAEIGWKQLPDNNSVPIYGESDWVYIKPDGSYASGWEKIKGDWYYFNPDNSRMNYNTWVENYYLGEDGKMLTASWIIEKHGTGMNMSAYYVGDNGKWIPEMVYHGIDGNWTPDQNGLKYLKTDNTFCQNEYEFIHGHWYGFDENGVVIAGINKNMETGIYYLFEKDGKLTEQTGWIPVGENQWVYVEKNGICLSNTVTPDGYTIGENAIWSQ